MSKKIRKEKSLANSASGAGVVVWSLTGPGVGAIIGIIVGSLISPLFAVLLTIIGVTGGAYLGMSFGKRPGAYLVFWFTLGGALLSAITFGLFIPNISDHSFGQIGPALLGGITGFLVGKEFIESRTEVEND